MAFSHRKFQQNKPEKKYASSCYMCYVCPKECYLKSPPPPPPPPLPQTSQSKNNQSSLILILMLCVLSAVFLFLSYLTIAKYRSRRRSSQINTVPDENHVSVLHHPIWYIRTVGLPQSSIDSISIIMYEKGKCSIESTDCSVCLSEFHENESLKLLPKCSHAFHVPCIDPWLRSHKNCPVCRAPVLIQGPNNVSSSSNNSVLPTEENQSDNEMGTRPQVQTGEASSENQLADILSISELNRQPKDNKFRVFSDLADRRLKLDQESVIWPVRRSVSMDFSSCSSMISCTKKDEGCSDQDSDVIAKRGRKNSTVYTMLKSSSFGCSLEKRPVSLKRSFSFSGKRQLRKSSGSLEAISIPGTQNRSR